MVCTVLLVLSLIGAFLAAAAVSGSLDNDSHVSLTPPSDVSPGGSGGGSVGGGGTTTVPDPDADRATVERNFPVYPGARRVASALPHLKPGGQYLRGATNYIVPGSVGKVYGWYRTHLAADHLRFEVPAVDRDPASNRIDTVFSGIRGTADPAVAGQMAFQPSTTRGSCVVIVDFDD